jgi:hypothetical protein
MNCNELKAQIDEQINLFQDNAVAFIAKGNKTAGKRSRLASNALAKLFKEWRKATLESSQAE